MQLVARRSLVASLLFACLLTPCEAASPPDMQPLTTVYFAQPQNDLPPWAQALSRAVADVVRTFMRNMLPDPAGNENPNVRESQIDQFVQRLNSRIGLVLQGTGNLKVLGGPYYYNELQGGAGVEFDLVPQPTDGSKSDTVVALRISPLYGEIALVRLDAGGGATTGLPTQSFIGASFGLEASQRIGRFEPGVRLYARPEWQAFNWGNSGVSIYNAIFCRIFLRDFKEDHSGKLYLIPTFSYYDRGGGLGPIYGWNAPGVERPPWALHKLWEATLGLEVLIR